MIFCGAHLRLMGSIWYKIALQNWNDAMAQFTFSELERKDPPPPPYLPILLSIVMPTLWDLPLLIHQSPQQPSAWPSPSIIGQFQKSQKIRLERSELLSGLRHIIVLHPYMSILFSLIQFCPTWISKIYIIAFMFLKQWRKFHCFFSDDINHINGWTIILAWWVIYPISWGQTLLRTEGQCHNKVMETVMIRAITSK